MAVLVLIPGTAGREPKVASNNGPFGTMALAATLFGIDCHAHDPSVHHNQVLSFRIVVEGPATEHH